MEHYNAVDEEDVIVYCHDNANVSVSDGDNIDVPVDNNVNGLVQDENISEDKHSHAMDKNSGDVVMATNKKYACCFWWR
ncbi:TIR-NBS-LRR RCT1 resistance protein [Trifolium medium]|uniref:TIR-NBS-LRR RCT1 resistance protein n=1 Tax=Trifolium medium TaxID=97028 RepID=A0A392NEC5_9FABA|nr:TIR-NBS-LRR RCT1 resistance protein [Trifolium medium]